MAKILFTDNLQRHIKCPQLNTQGANLSENLKDAFLQRPRLKEYLLNDQDELLPHINIFIDNKIINDRQLFEDPVGHESEIFIIQALSGG